MRKIISDALYTIDLENAKEEVVTVGIDATDIEQVDALVGLLDFFDEQQKSLKKRLGKLEKEYTDNVLIRQTLRVTTEVLNALNERIDALFGESVSNSVFLGRKSMVMYVQFFDELKKHFPAIVDKGEKSMNALVDKYDLELVKDDEVL